MNTPSTAPIPSETTPSAYEARRLARIDRLRARAERKAAEATAAHARAGQLASVIPMGQPILVGHHSEGRDRRYRDKIQKTYTRAAESAKEASDLARRADAAEENRSISGDDPTAIERLQEKLAGIQKSRATMTAANRIVRRAATTERSGDRSPGPELQGNLRRNGRNGAGSGVDVDVLVPELVALGFSAGRARELFEPDFAGRRGFPSYALTNASSEARRVEERIATLQAAAARPARTPVSGTCLSDGAPGGSLDVTVSEEDNRVRLVFSGKPSEAIRTRLKSEGFRWSPTSGAWQRHASAYAWQIACAYVLPGGAS